VFASFAKNDKKYRPISSRFDLKMGAINFHLYDIRHMT